MPITKIEVCRPRTKEQVAALMDAVYHAQREALKVPADDRQIRYVEYKPEHFPVPPDKTEDFVFIEIQIFPGRSLAAKRKLYQGIVSRLGALGIQATDVTIVLHEPPLENWGIRGLPASEVDLGFNLNV